MGPVTGVSPADLTDATRLNDACTADAFAHDLLCATVEPSPASILALFDLLPHEHPPRASPDGSGSSFSCGCYGQGGLAGLRKSCMSFPSTCLALNRYVASLDPAFEYSTISIFDRVQTALHRDARNGSVCNLVSALSSFRGGEIWVQDDDGPIPFSLNGEMLRGSLLDLQQGPVHFEARDRYHCTMPFSGRRVVLIAFCAESLHCLSVQDRDRAVRLGFPLPSTALSATCSPPIVPRSPPDLSAYLQKCRARIQGRPLSQLTFVEVFAGTAGLCAAVRRAGIGFAIGVDHKVLKGCMCKIAVLDLTTQGSRDVLFDLLQQPTTVACHLGPPCGTSSRARAFGSYDGGPRPLRSTACPDGIAGLQGLDLLRVQQANILYDLTSMVLQYGVAHGLLVSVENPHRSHFWASSPMVRASACRHFSTSFHACMFGSGRRKRTRLDLQVPCSNDHAHLPWTKDASGYSTRLEAAYPKPLCDAMAQAFALQLLDLGAVGVPVELSQAAIPQARAAAISVGSQPRAKKVPPLVAEHKTVIILRGPLPALPSAASKKIELPFAIPRHVHCQPTVSSIPAGSKILRVTPVSGGLPSDTRFEMAVGIP